ncbi:hypothetical protein JCM10213_000167 [Rhodosporidiobolus nylandii]
MSPPSVRLAALSRSLSSPSPQPHALTTRRDRPLLGHLTLGDLRLPVHEPGDPYRLPLREELLLDVEDEAVRGEVEWLMKKWALGQDLFLLTSPGPYTRRLALTFLALLKQPYEIVSLHRDVGETELKQGREIREDGKGGTKLVYTDGPAVRAMKEGKVLILDGIERCERGVLPLLNNALENREMNLSDGTHIVSSQRYELMLHNGEDTSGFMACHPDFRVIALGCPVPPYPGLPTDPPFRSRFQARYIDPVQAAKVLARQELARLGQAGRNNEQIKRVEEIVAKMAEVLEVQGVKREMRAKMASGISTSGADLPPFPQTTLAKLARFLSIFPAPSSITPAQLLSLLLTLHPALATLAPAGRRSLEELLLSAGFGSWAEGLGELDWAVALQAHAESGEGLLGWRLVAVERAAEHEAELTFSRSGSSPAVVLCAAGSFPFATFPPSSSDERHITPRVLSLLTSLFQLHALGAYDIAFVPSSSAAHGASSSTSLVLGAFAQALGYELSPVHLYKELSGRELWMRRVVGSSPSSSPPSPSSSSTATGPAGVTGWAPSPLTAGAQRGELVWLEGVDTLGATAGSLGRLWSDREGELWAGKRLTLLPAPDFAAGSKGGVLEPVHPAFRTITTATHSSTSPSTASSTGGWLTEELAANLLALPAVPMSPEEERSLLLSTSCSPPSVASLMRFATAYRALHAAEGMGKSRRLGTRALVRIARSLAFHPGQSTRTLLERALLTEFLPSIERERVEELFVECGMAGSPEEVYDPVTVVGEKLVFETQKGEKSELPLFRLEDDLAGASHIPYMDNYHDNSQQTSLMLSIGTDLVLLNEHVLLLGNQGTGKNKITDRLLQLLRRPREYIQLHRDSTTQSLLFSTSIEGGEIKYKESPLLRAVRLGRVLIIDEVDKAPPAVTAALSSLASRGEMTLPDGRRIRPSSASSLNEGDIPVHPSFRLILLANRPGFPFLGNPFLQVLGDAFSTYAIANPDEASEVRVLKQLAPELEGELLEGLVRAFQDLRKEFDKGTLTYPFSLRELLHLVRHMRAYPSEPLESALRNIFDFDLHHPETLDALSSVLTKHGLRVERVGMDAVRGRELSKEEKAKVVQFEPTGSTELSGPKFGKVDDKEHSGGNTWTGGTGGRDTAGLGGRGGYMRLYKGGDIKQIPDSLKADVPEHITEKAREMARRELAAKLAELEMSGGQATLYSRYHDAVAAHVQQLVSFFENLEAKEEERVWLKRQSDGELDEGRLSEGLTGEQTVYKRRGTEKPELGRPQLKPKRIRFVFDVSASMYRNQFDGRLARSLEAAVMVMEAFDRLSSTGKQKYLVDVTGHSGEDPEIKLVEAGKWPEDAGERFKILEKMSLTSQFCWPGDETIRAIEKAVDAVAEGEADDRLVIAITDANFSRYNITSPDLSRALARNSSVRASLIAIGEGAECEWLPKELPGKAFRVKEAAELARTIRAVVGEHLGGV